MTALTITELVKLAGENSRDHGFHEDWAKRPMDGDVDEEISVTDHRRCVAEKLGLIHEEISEALGEIRSGHDVQHVYYSQKHKSHTGNESIFYYDEQLFGEEDGKPISKPEGFGVELADAVIRIADLAYLTGIDLETLIREKHQYNATRPFKHGRKF
jgi:hypothetical protein